MAGDGRSGGDSDHESGGEGRESRQSATVSIIRQRCAACWNNKFDAIMLSRWCIRLIVLYQDTTLVLPPVGRVRNEARWPVSNSGDATITNQPLTPVLIKPG